MTGVSLDAAGCGSCGQRWLAVGLPPFCARCGAGGLARVEALPGVALERVVPFALDRGALREVFARFVRPVWFPPAGLRPEALAARAVRVWVPSWWVDVDVVATWEAEIGFDYDVESAQESLAHGTWRSQTVIETRVRWEPRAGEVVHAVHDVAVAAVPGLHAAFGEWPGTPRPVRAADLDDALVRWPDVTTTEAWPEAQHGITAAIGEVVREAAGGQHVRSVYVTGDRDALAWTWLLQPVWVTVYADHEGRSWPIAVHGTTGAVLGVRRGDPRRGRWVALAIAATSACGFAVSLLASVVGLLLVPLLVLGVIGMAVSLAGLGLALVPWLAPITWNGRQGRSPLP